MIDDEPFVDCYKILRVSPNCDTKALETAYRNLAKRYHPDHPETADVTKFEEVIEAFRTLRHPEGRARYDSLYARATGFEFDSAYEEAADEPEYLDNQVYHRDIIAISDAEVHEKFLLFLYKRRRENAQDAGVGRYFVQKMLGCSDDHFEFHIWYLREKGFIQATEQGALAITIEGIDHVISMSRKTMRDRLLIAQAKDFEVQSKL